MNSETIHSLKIELDESQLPPISNALKKLSKLHRSQFKLEENSLSIEAVDVSALIGLIDKSSENELAMFRFKKSVTDLILSRIEHSKNQSRIEFYKSCITHIQNTKVGQHSATFLEPQTKEPNRIDLLT